MSPEKKPRHKPTKSAHQKQLRFFLIFGMCLMISVMVLLLWLLNSNSLHH